MLSSLALPLQQSLHGSTWIEFSEQYSWSPQLNAQLLTRQRISVFGVF